MSRPVHHRRSLPSSLTGALKLDVAAEIQMVTDYLQHLMEEMHGGAWHNKVDHKNGFVIVVLHPERRSS